MSVRVSLVVAVVAGALATTVGAQVTTMGGAISPTAQVATPLDEQGGVARPAPPPGGTNPTSQSPGAAPAPAPAPTSPPSTASAPAGPRPAGRIPGSGVTRRRSRTAPAAVRWDRWWELNKERFLNLGDRRRLVTVTPRHSLGTPTPATLASLVDHRLDATLRALATATRDDHRAVRMAASYALGFAARAETLPDLARALRDRELGVRETAVVAMGMSGQSAATATLVDVVEGKRPGAESSATLGLRSLAALSLGLLGDEAASRALERVAFRRDVGRQLRVSALIGIGLIRDPNSRRLLDRALDARWCGSSERAAVATALGCQQHRDALTPLVRLLRDRHVIVRRAAALAIGTFPRQAVLSRSLAAAKAQLAAADSTAMTGHARQRLAEYIAREREALAQARTDEAAGWAKIRAALRRLATKDADHGARAYSLIALGQVGELEDADLLGRTLRRGRHDHRGFAAIALGVLARNHETAREKVHVLLRKAAAREESTDLRAAIHVARGLARDRGAVDAITGDLSLSRGRRLRGYAGTALGLIGDARVADRVATALLEAREDDELQNIALGLALIGGPNEVARCGARLARSTDTREQIVAAIGLAFVGGTHALDALERFLANPKKPALARAFVAEGLGLAIEHRCRPPLVRITGGYDEALGFDSVARIVRIKW